MIGLIPVISNDYLLTLSYIVIIIISLVIKHEHLDFVALVFGFIMMTIFESIFISTGVETFNRNSLLGLMPLWLPVLWAYGFIAIKRGLNILSE